MSALRPRVLGVGYEVPAQIRTNDDPIFDWLKKNPPSGSNLFEGYDKRRVLTGDLAGIMVPAALKALDAAGLRTSDVDLLVGTASSGSFVTPNELCLVHRELALPERAWTIPLANDFTNFNAGLLLADGLIRAGRVRNVLIVVGSDWTRWVDYHTPQSVSASDAAGAAVMGLSDDPKHWEILDQETVTQSSYYGTMFLEGDRLAINPPQEGHDALWTRPYFQITEAGVNGFETFGVEAPPRLTLDLMARNHLTGPDVALISHQASSVLIDAWDKAIAPAQYPQTIGPYANMTGANIPVNLAWAVQNQPIAKDRLVLLGLGPDMHANALLLGRGAGERPA